MVGGTNVRVFPWACMYSLTLLPSTERRREAKEGYISLTIPFFNQPRRHHNHIALVKPKICSDYLCIVLQAVFLSQPAIATKTKYHKALSSLGKSHCLNGNEVV